MKVFKYNSSKLVTLQIPKYKIDWGEDGASSLEKRFIKFIEPIWKHSIVLFQCRIPGSLMRIDILNLNKKLAVEINGSQHNEFNAFFMGNSRNKYLASIKRDLDKETWCIKNGISLLTINENDLDKLSVKYIQEKFGIDIL